MIHEGLILVYRLITLFVLCATIWGALDDENDGYLQFTAVVLTIPLALRFLMIK